MHLAHARKASEEPPEHMFAAKYSWLLRWALQFTENDREAAEDLVQETFVRVLLTWDTLHSLHDLEPLLYSYLKYAHLSERRRKSRYPLQSLMAADADTLAASLRSSTLFDQIEVQSELRSILSYLLWRRHTAKFASIFLLRFFHGYYPEQIASIILATRHSVDLSLRQARSELKAHLLESRRGEAPARSSSEGLAFRDAPVPREEFADELRREIFASPRGLCPSGAELTRHYSSLNSRSVDSDLLAHIVVCKPCLTAVTSLAGMPPPEARSTEDSFSSAPRDSAYRGATTDDDRATIEATYRDPHFVATAASDPAVSTEPVAFPSTTKLSWRARVASRLRRFGRSFVDRDERRVLTFAALTASTIAIVTFAGTGVWSRSHRAHEQALFLSTLNQLQTSESFSRSGRKVGAVHQRLQIKVRGKVVVQDVYRDIEGRREPKQGIGAKQNVQVGSNLLQAAFDWADPLSEKDFTRWHSQLAHANDHVKESPRGLLVLTSDVPDGPVRRESLTIRIEGLHPVARTVEFQNEETLEVAELSYDVVPWGPVSNAWFEADSGAVSANKLRGDSRSFAPVAAPLDESEIDVAMLSAMRALQQLHADAERLQIVRSSKGVSVEGVVESNARKFELVSQLGAIPHVQANISSYLDLDANSALSSSISEIKAESVVSGISQLDRYCISAHKPQEVCRQASYRLLNLATIVARDGKKLADLQDRFAGRDSFDLRIQRLMSQLVHDRVGHLEAALAEQQALVASLGLAVETIAPPSEPLALANAAERNLAAVRELVDSSDENARPAAALAEDILRSQQHVRDSLLQIPWKPVALSAASSETPTPHSK